MSTTEQEIQDAYSWENVSPKVREWMTTELAKKLPHLEPAVEWSKQPIEYRRHRAYLMTRSASKDTWNEDRQRLADAADPETVALVERRLCGEISELGEESTEGVGLISLNTLNSHRIPRPLDWPELGEAALHGLAGDIVRAIDPHTEADPVAVLLTLLTGFGAAVGRGPHALADGAEHPARLFTVLVGNTSKARKGTSWQQVRRVLTVADKSFTEDRILGGFGSGEAVVDAVQDAGDRKLLVIEPEWARLLAVGKREGSTLSALLRQAWDGDTLAIRSRSSGTVTAVAAHVAALGHVTTDELRMKLTDTEIANGFANRHLFALVSRSKLLPSGGNLSPKEINGLGSRLSEALRRARGITLVERTQEAEDCWDTLYSQMADDEPGGLVGSIIARDSAQVLRLSVIYALLDGSSAITKSHLDAAHEVWAYCRASARVIFGDSVGNPIADKLLRAIQSAGETGMTGTERSRALAGHVTREEIESAVRLLVDRRLVTLRKEDSGGAPVWITTAAQHAE